MAGIEKNQPQPIQGITPPRVEPHKKNGGAVTVPPKTLPAALPNTPPGGAHISAEAVSHIKELDLQKMGVLGLKAPSDADKAVDEFVGFAKKFMAASAFQERAELMDQLPEKMKLVRKSAQVKERVLQSLHTAKDEINERRKALVDDEAQMDAMREMETVLYLIEELRKG